MTTTLFDVLGTSIQELQDYIDQGLIRRQHHASEPLAILNYTERVTFSKHWDAVTLNCRGLIYNTKTLEIVARPFPKFFNTTEESAAKFSLDEKVFVTDKKDGSMGILYRRPSDGEYAIATRGSFNSEQALRATKILLSKYGQGNWYEILLRVDDLPWTYVFEIIYPSNRIVLDYGDMEDLIMLGMVGHKTGTVLSANQARVSIAWPGPTTEAIGYMTYAEALATPPRLNSEGVVILAAEGTSRMAKLKQEDYVHLHRIITGLNARSVWAHMVANDLDTDQLKKNLPEEFWGWVDDVADQLDSAAYDLLFEIENEYFKRVVVGGDRGQNARAFAGYEYSWGLFALLDDDRLRVFKKVWQMIRPESDWSPHGARAEEA